MITKCLSRRFAAFAVSGLVAGMAMPAMAQEAPSRVTPESIIPPANPDKPSLNLQETPFSAAPEGSENLSVTLADVVVENADPRFAGAIAAITATAKDQTRTVAEL